MKQGTLYGIGVGPGDPDLITVKAARILAGCEHVFVPRPRKSAQGVAMGIARSHMHPRATVHEVIFPMTKDPVALQERWYESAGPIAEVLLSGTDACYVTLGDTMLYSTYIYMLRALRRRVPDVNVITLPGVTSFSAVAALTEFSLGEGTRHLTIVPSAQDLSGVSGALATGGTVVLMKIGRRLRDIIELLEDAGAIDRSVFVARAGMENQRIETDLRGLKEQAEDDTGNLSIILVHGQDPGHPGAS